MNAGDVALRLLASIGRPREASLYLAQFRNERREQFGREKGQVRRREGERSVRDRAQSETQRIQHRLPAGRAQDPSIRRREVAAEDDGIQPRFQKVAARAIEQPDALDFVPGAAVGVDHSSP